jgi:aryl-alcohol dehydrogenase-like predicted oxidoreductase
LGGYGWGKVSEKETIKAIHRAIDTGISLFDTAPIYGLGRSEEILGKSLGAVRKNVIIATKVGLVWKKNKTFERYPDSSPTNIEREVDKSLRRLRTDYIDLYHIHWPDPNTPIEDTWLAMEKLRQSGKIRCIGCCNFPLGLLKELLQCGEIDTVQIPYSLIDRKVEKDLLPFCKENRIAVLAYSPLARGLLTGKYDRNAKFERDDHRSRGTDGYFQGKAFLENLEIVERIRSIAERLNKTPAQIALRWVLENPYVTSALFGAKSVAQTVENIVASDFTLSNEDMEFLSKR